MKSVGGPFLFWARRETMDCFYGKESENAKSRKSIILTADGKEVAQGTESDEALET